VQAFCAVRPQIAAVCPIFISHYYNQQFRGLIKKQNVSHFIEDNDLLYIKKNYTINYQTKNNNSICIGYSYYAFLFNNIKKYIIIFSFMVKMHRALSYWMNSKVKV